MPEAFPQPMGFFKFIFFEPIHGRYQEIFQEGARLFSVKNSFFVFDAKTVIFANLRRLRRK